jgi:hypothetical protein
MSNEQLPSEVRATRAWWTITVTGYGSFAYYGTAGETRNRMRAKASWEGGRGSMRTATEAEIEKEKAHLRDQKSRGVTLDENELEALQ